MESRHRGKVDLQVIPGIAPVFWTSLGLAGLIFNLCVPIWARSDAILANWAVSFGPSLILI